MKRRILALLLSVASAFTCAFGLSACGGNDGVGIKSATINASGELVLTLTDYTVLNLGKVTGKDGADGNDGTDGKDGVGVKTAYIDDDGNLIIELTNGEKVNCGNVSDNTERPAGNGFTFSEVKSGDEVTGYELKGVGEAYEADLAIPAWYKGKPVVGIGESAFLNAVQLTSVTVPDCVTYIGKRAFHGCASLQNITLGKGVASVGEFAFGRCAALENVYIMDLAGWCEIEFENASANPLYFAGNLFVNNSALTTVRLPDSVSKIGDYAFYEIESIESVDTGDGVQSIGESAFAGCTSLKDVTVGNGAVTISDSAFLGCEQLESAVIGNSVQSIGDYAFYQCLSLQSIVVPPSVQSIGECAFADCSNLDYVTLNEGLKTIGDSAFSMCSYLKKFNMPSTVTQIGFGILMFSGGGAGFGETINPDNYLHELTLSDNLLEIPDFAFSGCNISEVTIGSKVTKICYSSFYGCSALKIVVIPKSVKTISSYAFYNCSSIERVYYTGTAAEWKSISIGRNGNSITDEKVALYYYSETEPTVAGNYWHYVDGNITVWRAQNN